MRILLLAALLLLAVPATAQPTEFGFSTDYNARVAVGDVPLTEAVEPAGFVHSVESVRFSHDGNQTEITVPGTFVERGCTCAAFSATGATFVVPSSVPAGDYVFWVLRQAPADLTFSIHLPWLAEHASSAEVHIYAPAGNTVTASASSVELPGVGGDWTIYSFTGTRAAPLSGFWATSHPELADGPVVVAQERGFGYLELALGIVLGIVLWFWLVQKGFVQARSRKQVVAKAAHEEVAQSESQEMLAARKRILMAGLKELEMAKMKAEVDDGTYDRLKTELKKEAVTTMRALEQGE